MAVDLAPLSLRLRLATLTRDQQRDDYGRYMAGSSSHNDAIAAAERAHPVRADGTPAGGHGYVAHREAEHLRASLGKVAAKVAELRNQGKHSQAEQLRSAVTWRGAQGVNAIKDRLATVERAAGTAADHIDATSIAELQHLYRAYQERAGRRGLPAASRARMEAESLRIKSFLARRSITATPTQPSAVLSKTDRADLTAAVDAAIAQETPQRMQTTIDTVRLRLAALRRNFEYTDSHGNVHAVSTDSHGRWTNNQVISHVMTLMQPAKLGAALKAKAASQKTVSSGVPQVADMSGKFPQDQYDALKSTINNLSANSPDYMQASKDLTNLLVSHFSESSSGRATPTKSEMAQRGAALADLYRAQYGNNITELINPENLYHFVGENPIATYHAMTHLPSAFLREMVLHPSVEGHGIKLKEVNIARQGEPPILRTVPSNVSDEQIARALVARLRADVSATPSVTQSASPTPADPRRAAYVQALADLARQHGDLHASDPALAKAHAAHVKAAQGAKTTSAKASKASEKATPSDEVFTPIRPVEDFQANIAVTPDPFVVSYAYGSDQFRRMLARDTKAKLLDNVRLIQKFKPDAKLPNKAKATSQQLIDFIVQHAATPPDNHPLVGTPASRWDDAQAPRLATLRTRLLALGAEKVS